MVLHIAPFASNFALSSMWAVQHLKIKTHLSNVHSVMFSGSHKHTEIQVPILSIQHGLIQSCLSPIWLLTHMLKIKATVHHRTLRVRSLSVFCQPPTFKRYFKSFHWPYAQWCTICFGGAQCSSMVHKVATCTVVVVHNVGLTSPGRQTNRQMGWILLLWLLMQKVIVETHL